MIRGKFIRQCTQSRAIFKIAPAFSLTFEGHSLYIRVFVDPVLPSSIPNQPNGFSFRSASPRPDAERRKPCIDTADVYPRWAMGQQAGESETIIGKWLMLRQGITAPIVSATRLKQLEELMTTTSLRLEEPSVELLNSASA